MALANRAPVFLVQRLLGRRFFEALVVTLWCTLVMPAIGVHHPDLLRLLLVGHGSCMCGRSKVSEVRSTLLGLRTNLEAFRAEYDRYPPLVARSPIVPPSGQRAAWTDEHRFCPDTCTHQDVAACTELACTGYSPASDRVYYRYTCATTETDFTCVAVGDLDDDGETGMFVYGTNHAGGDTIAVAVPDIGFDRGTCADASKVPAGDLFDCRPNVY